MNSQPPPAATTWGALLVRHDPAVRRLVAQQMEALADVGDRDPEDLSTVFAGEDKLLSRGILACGTAEVRPIVRRLHPVLPEALAALSSFEKEHSLEPVRILSFAMIAECTGTRRPAEFSSAALKPLIRARTELTDVQQRSAAMLALALGDTATARGLIDAAPKPFTQPVVRFEFNLYELVRYLADAIDQRRPSDWIETAWVEYIVGFPLHLEADAAEWPDIFHFARILANVRGDKVSDIADDLHARVQLLAKQGQ